MMTFWNQDMLHHRKYMTKIASSVPTTSDSFSAETAYRDQRTRRRRRGEVVNPANTLDGLVAKRAIDIGAKDSLYKRYLAEAEAIEGPSDDQEIKVSKHLDPFFLNPDA
ncbi:unnamed protein product [Gongylonema pulchrum]|uniref:Uncharacterized protein n=1 Tax=Gongylonema pulchrum TaxID=637853 RepID=A0A183EEC6_9BILA|nr:unnamed protein product [Gongylonema pulchrum]